jgi:hypothetical protein
VTQIFVMVIRVQISDLDEGGEYQRTWIQAGEADWKFAAGCKPALHGAAESRVLSRDTAASGEGKVF